MNKSQKFLRGGGCGTTKFEAQPIFPQKQEVLQESNLLNNLRKYSNLISEKSSIVFDKTQNDDVMIAIQWFNVNKENFNKMCQNKKMVGQVFDIAINSLDLMLKQISVYLRSSGFLCLQILQICNDLFRIVFSFLLKNEDRFMEDTYKQQILEYLSDFENNLKIESQSIWMTGAEFELVIMKACVENCRSNSQKGQELLINFMSGLVSSFLSLSPTEDLIYSFIEGGKFILTAVYKKIENSIKIYEIYFYFETLKWLIINQLKQKQFSVQSQLNQLIDGYNKYIINSKDWIIHFCWLKLITELLTYRPILNKFDFFKNQDSIQQQLNWNKLVQNNSLTLLSYNRNEAKINLFNDYQQIKMLEQFENQIQGLSLHKIKQFQKYLLEEKLFGKQNICQSYIQFTFNQQINNSLFTNPLSNLDIDKCQNTLIIINKTALDYNNLIYEIQLHFNNLRDKKGEKMINVELQQDHCITLIYQIGLNAQSLIYFIFENYQQLLILSNICQFTSLNLDQIKYSDDQKQKLIQLVSKIRDNFGDTFQQLIQEIQQSIFQQYQMLSNYEINFCNSQNSSIELSEQLNNNQIIRFAQQSTKILNNINQFFEYSNTLHSLSADQKVIQNQQFIQIMNKLISKDLLNYTLKQSLIIFEKIQSKQNQPQITLIDQRQANLNLQYLIDGIILQIKIYQYQICKVQFAIKSSFDQEKHSNNKNIIVNLQQQQREILLKQQQFVEDLFQENKLAQQLNKEKINNLIKKINFDFEFLNNTIPQKELKQELMQFFMEVQSLLLQIQFQPQNIDNYEEKLKKIYKDQMNFIDNYSSTNNQQEENTQSQLQKYLTQLKDINSFFQQKLSDFSEFQQNLKEINTFLQNALKILDQKTVINQVQNEVIQTFKTKHYGQFINDIEEIKSFQEIEFQLNEEQIENDKMQRIIDIIYNFDEHLDQIFEVEIELDPFIQQSQEQIKAMSNQERNNNDSGLMDFKVRECLAFNIIKMQQIIQEEYLYNFSQSIIQQIWIHEKDERVKGVLKNKEMIELQRRLFSKNLKSVSEQLKSAIQQKFDQINLIELEMQQEIDEKKKDQLQKNLLILNQDLEEYVEGITEMSQKMDLNFAFLKEIQKQLNLIKERIQNIQKSINQLSFDLSRLVGKSYEELLEIRKQRVLMIKENQEINEVYIQLKTMRVDPITGQELQVTELTGDIQDFLHNEQKLYDVLLITGKAGSGKSKASEKIEFELWSNYTNNQQWIPLLISLPTIKQPQFNIIEQALEKDIYQFDKMQIQEFKEAIKKKKLKVVIILDSYDEMRQEFIYSNLFHTNRFVTEFGQDIISSNFKVIITTRKELLNVMGYQTWFCGSALEKMKEITIQNLNEDQIQDYIKQYCLHCIKKSIINIYEALLSLSKQEFIKNDFFLVWNSIFEFLEKETNYQNNSSNQILSNLEISKLIRLLKSKSSFRLLSDNQAQQLYQNLCNIWSISKYQQIIKGSNLQMLFNTPFMLSVVVQVLPNLTKSNQEITVLQDQFLKNYVKIKQNLIKSDVMINKYKNNRIQQDLNIKEIKDIGIQIQMDLNNQQFFSIYSNSSTLEMIDEKQLKILNKAFYIENDANIIYESFKQKKFTSYQFYESFINYYHDQQINKWKKLGITYNYETVKVDLQEFSQSLALDMTKNQVTSIEYKIKGELKIKKAQNFSQFQEEWQDQYFNDSYGEKEYKALIRNSMLIIQSGCNYSFTHTSIQEFFVAKYIYEFIQQIDLNQDLSNLNKDQQYLMEKIEYSLYNQKQFNLTQDHFLGCLNILKKELLLMDQIKQKLLILVKTSGIFPKLERASSNSIYLLSFLNINVSNQNFKNICLSDTKLYGLNFYNSNMENSKFNNVAIDSCNFNKANLSNVEWVNMICKEKVQFKGHRDYIRSITISLDGLILISGGEDNLIIIWNSKSCQEKYILEGHTDIIRQVCISSDNETLASGSNDKTIRLWSLKTGQQLEILEGHENSVTCLIFSYDNSILFSGSQDNKIRLWNVKSKQTIGILEGHVMTITQLILFKNGKRLISSSEDKKIIIWDLINRVESGTLKNDSEVLSISLHPQEQLLSCGNKDGRIMIYDIKEFRLLSALTGHGSNVNCLGFTRNGQILASGSDDQSVRLWDVKTFKQIGYLQGHSHFVTSLVFSPDGMILYSGSQDKIIRQWNVEATKQDYELDGHLNYISSISFSPDGQMLASGSRDCSVKLWDIEECALICTLQGHTDMIWCVLFSPVKMILASGADDQTIRIWDPLFQKQLHVIDTECDCIQSLAFSNDGQTLASGSGGFSYIVKIWNLKDYSLMKMFNVHSQTINTLQFMQNDKIVTGGADNQIIISDLVTGNKELQIKIHRGSISCLKLINNNVISASSDHTIKFYDLDEKKEISVISGHENAISSLAISPDSKILISGSDDMTIRIWDYNTKDLMQELQTSDQVKCVDFCPNGQVIAAGCFDGSIYLQKMNDNHKFEGYQSFSKCPLIQAKECLLKKSIIETKTDSMVRLLLQKGAIEK